MQLQIVSQTMNNPWAKHVTAHLFIKYLHVDDKLDAFSIDSFRKNPSTQLNIPLYAIWWDLALFVFA